MRWILTLFTFTILFCIFFFGFNVFPFTHAIIWWCLAMACLVASPHIFKKYTERQQDMYESASNRQTIAHVNAEKKYIQKRTAKVMSCENSFNSNVRIHFTFTFNFGTPVYILLTIKTFLWIHSKCTGYIFKWYGKEKR